MQSTENLSLFRHLYAGCSSDTVSFPSEVLEILKDARNKAATWKVEYDEMRLQNSKQLTKIRLLESTCPKLWEQITQISYPDNCDVMANAKWTHRGLTPAELQNRINTVYATVPLLTGERVKISVEEFFSITDPKSTSAYWRTQLEKCKLHNVLINQGVLASEFIQANKSKTNLQSAKNLDKIGSRLCITLQNAPNLASCVSVTKTAPIGKHEKKVLGKFLRKQKRKAQLNLDDDQYNQRFGNSIKKRYN